MAHGYGKGAHGHKHHGHHHIHGLGGLAILFVRFPFLLILVGWWLLNMGG